MGIKRRKCFQAAYTWSKSMDDASSYNNNPQNPYNRNAERAYSDYNRPQMLVFNYIYNLPFFINPAEKCWAAGNLRESPHTKAARLTRSDSRGRITASRTGRMPTAR